ncbi:IS30 family transposase [Nocardiopsis sp. Huas11]|nr:IS30 family transposase [Nocardiopsis sp. Huas11]RKS07845.1 IS30 family transposase [Nocardiopsis sp. Huas11]RKS08236.1 IS30 family transposase [Nocardiopsis sp. Huas11]RKS10862.1 IS30 family transposase [Nocardiopsis sp. Huas11]
MSFSKKELARLRTQFLEQMAEIGSVTEVARRLGVNRNTAFSWARKAGLRSQRQQRPHPARQEYERLRNSAVPRPEAARRAGINERTARDWDHGVRKSRNSRFYPDGRRVNYSTGQTTIESMTSPPAALDTLQKQVHPRFLTLADRERIADLDRAGWSRRAIGRDLGRPASTIKRELDHHRNADGSYGAYTAQRRASAQRVRPKPAKLAAPGRLRDYVAQGLRKRWSPEQISNRLVEDFPGEEDMRVSHETIYQALYVQSRGGLKREVSAALRTGRLRRTPHRSPEHRRSRFTDPMVMISERPAEVEDRAVPGHWEGDLITGAHNKSAIITLVERSTRYVMLGHVPGEHTAEAVGGVLSELITALPDHLRGSLTWDQGSEMAGHKAFSVATGVPVFFCDPASPWQRGSNENTNGLLRQYFPKGTDLSVHGRLDLEHVAQELNERPRKTLGWETPAERLATLV